MNVTAQRPTEEELRLFSARIAQRLADRPLDLDPSTHQQRVAGLLRKAYDRELAPDLWSASWSAVPDRRHEAGDLARSYYERAMVLASADDLHFAIELLKQAVRADARPGYHALLGRLQAKNPRWLRAASENLRRAVDLGSRDPELPAALEQALERLQAGEALAPGPAAPADTPGNGSTARSTCPCRRRASVTAFHRAGSLGLLWVFSISGYNPSRRRASGSRSAGPSGLRGEESPSSYGRHAR